MVLRPFLDNLHTKRKGGISLYTTQNPTQTATLEKKPQLVTIQMNFTNKDVIPPAIRKLGAETLKKSVERKRRHTGIQVLKPTENVSVLGFLEDIKSAGYKLIDAFYEPRIDRRDSNKTYHMVRFVFGQNGKAKLFERVGGLATTVLMAGLRKMCADAAWRVRGYVNPFYYLQEEIEGEKSLMICLEARRPLFLPNGEPVREWQRSTNSCEKIGDEPIPTKPRWVLELKDKELRIV